MITIKFSHRYKKMPHGVEHLTTWISGVEKTHFNNLTPEELEQDTAILGGGNYPLPKMDLIKISLFSVTINGRHDWQTYRPYNPGKMKYYTGEKGHEVKIAIVPLDKQK